MKVESKSTASRSAKNKLRRAKEVQEMRDALALGFIIRPMAANASYRFTIEIPEPLTEHTAKYYAAYKAPYWTVTDGGMTWAWIRATGGEECFSIAEDIFPDFILEEPEFALVDNCFIMRTTKERLTQCLFRFAQILLLAGQSARRIIRESSEIDAQGGKK